MLAPNNSRSTATPLPSQSFFICHTVPQYYLLIFPPSSENISETASIRLRNSEIPMTPVREGLTALQLQGLIVTRPQRGSFVFMPSAEDVAELCEFRMVMESRALILCHARAKEATLAAFDRANEAMRNAQGSGQHLASARADADFHDALFVGCGNQYLSQAYSLISGKIGALRANLMQPDVDIRSGSIAEHAEIIDAFRTNDLLRAEAALAGHVFSMRERFAIAQETRQPTSDKRFRVGYKWPGTVESRKY